MSGLSKERVIEIANNIVITQYGSVPFLNNFGSNILQYVDSLMNNDDINDLKIQVENQFRLWLPNYLKSIEILQTNETIIINVNFSNIGQISIDAINLIRNFKQKT